MIAILKNKFQKIPSTFEKIIEKNGIPKTNRIIKIPHRSKNTLVCKLTSTKAKSNFEPSSGGMGIKLKTPKITFQKISIPTIQKIILAGEPARISDNPSQSLLINSLMIVNFDSSASGINKPITAATKAMKKLVKGPAKATKTSPHFPPRRAYGLYGTGFAHPNAKPVVYTIIMGKIIEPIGSMCFVGSSVRRPASLAV